MGCFMSLIEVLYRVLRDESEKEGRLAYQQCLALPIVWIRESESLSMRAAEIKGQHSSAVADA